MADGVTHSLVLALHPDGWHVHASVPSTGINQQAKISITQAEAVARAFGDATTGAAFQTTPFEIARQGSLSLRASVQKALSEAEQAAASIAGLRSTLAEVESQNG